MLQLYIYTYLLFFKLLQNIEQSSLCYTVGPCWLSTLKIAVYICQSQIPNLSLSPFVTLNLFPKPVGLFLLCK